MKRGGVLLAVLLLAACSSGGGSDSDAVEAPPPPPSRTVLVGVPLPFQGSSAEQTESMMDAMELYLDGIDHRVGDIRIELLRMDTSIPYKGAPYENYGCTVAGKQTVAKDNVVGIVGPYSSGCARRLLDELKENPIAVVSPSNTDDGLTHKSAASLPGEPERFYRDGRRHYTRVVAPDDEQARVSAELMASLGAERVCVLNDRSEYGRGIAASFTAAVEELGVEVVCSHGWKQGAADVNYLPLMERVTAAGADGLYLAGVSDYGGGELLRDKVTEVGDNQTVPVVVSDGFVVDDLFEDAGAANVEGVYGTTPVLGASQLGRAAQHFTALYAERYGEPPKLYAPYAAAALEALVDAIGRSDGTRAGVLEQLMGTTVADGIIGPVSFDANGDRRDAPIAVYQARGGDWEFMDAR